MPVVALKEIVDRAFAQRYGVAAINVVNDLTLEAVLAAAVEQRAPVIVQTSVKTVRMIGREVLFSMWTSMTAGIEVPVSLHLDHCPDRQVITDCLRTGWNSVLFDASSLLVSENLRQTQELIRIGQKVNSVTRTMGMALASCTPPAKGSPLRARRGRDGDGRRDPRRARSPSREAGERGPDRRRTGRGGSRPTCRSSGATTWR